MLEAAEGQTVKLWMYGGDEQGNAYVNDVLVPAAAELGVTLEQVPDAITRLKAAIAEDKERHRQHVLDEEVRNETTADGGSRPVVSLTQRAVPLLAMLEESLGEKKPVVWGV